MKAILHDLLAFIGAGLIYAASHRLLEPADPGSGRADIELGLPEDGRGDPSG